MRQQVPLEDRKRIAERFGLNHWSDQPSPMDYVLMTKIVQLEDQIEFLSKQLQVISNNLPTLSPIPVQSSDPIDEFVPEEQ